MKRLFFPMFTVSKCVSCGKRVAGNAVKMCVDCGRRYATERAKSCSVCGFPHELCRCALNAGGGLYRVLHAVPYDPKNYGIVSRIVFNAKDKYITENFKFIASECVRILYKNDIEVDKDTVVTWIPRRKKTIRRIGHDQSKLIARYVAHELELPLVRVFANKGNAPQKKQGFSDRIKNAGDSYLITRCGRKKISRKFVIIVDDLVTTGATMQVAISLALANGAEDVVPLTFAKTDRGHKKYTGRR